MDFGLAAVARDSNSLLSTPSEHGSTARWAAPEVLRGASPSEKSDVFSFGMVMMEVGDDGSASSQVTLSVNEGLHWRRSVQQLYRRSSYNKHNIRGTSEAARPPQFHRPLMGVESAVLEGGTARPPADGSSDKAPVSFSLQSDDGRLIH